MGSIEAYETTKGRRYRVLYRRPDHLQTSKARLPHEVRRPDLPGIRRGRQGQRAVCRPGQEPDHRLEVDGEVARYAT